MKTMSEKVYNELSALFNISHTLTKTLNLETVLQTTIDSVSRLAKLDSGAIYLIRGDKLYLGAATPPLPDEFPETFRRAKLNDHPHIQKAITESYPVTIPETEEAELSAAEREIVTSRNLRSLLYIPLIIENRVIGIFILGTVGKPREFSDSELRLYYTVSNQTALAVENAILFRENQNYTANLEEKVALKTTELSKANEAQKASEERYRLHLKQTPLGVIEWDTNFKVIEWNRAAEEIFGFKKEEVFGKEPTEIILPESENSNVEKLKNILIKKGSKSGIYHNITKEGRNIICEWHNTPIINETGDIIAIASVVKEITDKIKIEEALIESEKRFRDMADLLPQGIFEMDLRGYFTYGNKAGRKANGYTENDIKNGIHALQLFIPEERKRVEENLKKIIRGKYFRDNEYTILRKDGTTFRALIYATAVYKDKKPAGVRGIVIDITEIKQAETELRKAKEEAENANKLKDKFVALVSHDLRNPLSAISGYFQMLQSNDNFSDEEKEWVSEGLRAAEEMNKLISEVLNLSKIKSGMIRPKCSFLQAENLINLIIPKYHNSSEKKGVKIINELPKYTRMYADERLTTEVFSNLISNAVKFCSKGDTIKIYKIKNNPLTIAVEDTGRGIPANIVPLLFKYEEKTSMKGTSGELGTGLGLPLVNDIMNAHKGHIKIESKENEGCIIHLEFPVAVPLVLLIDDNKAERSYLKKSLEKLNVEFIEAGTGVEALKFMKIKRPDLILLDLKMPDMNGFEFLETIKGQEITNEIPIIAITVDDRIETRDKIFAYGADDFIAKPITKENFEPRIRRFTG
ncbi:MAG: PAS domain S-box protein [Spirochaetia bacterium]|nr:PAS domain S-box protein [Spirochaetia bacterium]